MSDQDINNATMSRQIALICSNCGWGSGKPSAEQGPVELLNAGLAERLAAKVMIVNIEPSMRAGRISDENIESAIMSHASNVSNMVVAAIQEGCFPVVVGGDHTSALGFYAGLARSYGETGIVWVDTHPDLNTPETSPSGNIHGMVLGGILRRGSDPMLQATTECQTREEHVAMVGVRSIDEGEQRWLDEGTIHCLKMVDVYERGLTACMTDAVETANKAAAGYGLTIDIDVIDPTQVPFVATPVENGVDAEDLVQALSTLPNKDRLLGMEVVEFTPLQESDAAVACDLITALVTAATCVAV